jgi:2-methylcitrate dehydratase PrpD
VLDGPVGLKSYDDAHVRSARVIAMRSKIRLVPDPEVARAAANLTATLIDGSTESRSVEYARGSLEVPLSDDQLDRKVLALVERTLPGREKEIVDAGRDVAAASSARGWFSALADNLTNEEGTPA